MRFTVALMLLQQPANGLLLSAETTCYLYDIRYTIYYLGVVRLYEIRSTDRGGWLVTWSLGHFPPTVQNLD